MYELRLSLFISYMTWRSDHKCLDITKSSHLCTSHKIPSPLPECI